jgi:thioredoxin 1
MAAEVTSKNFKKEVLEAKRAVLVDFFAEWCGPCKMMSPIIDELAKKMEDKIKIVKVNIEESGGLAGEYGIMSIPTFLFFKNGKIVEQVSGAMPKDKMEALIKKIVK